MNVLSLTEESAGRQLPLSVVVIATAVCALPGVHLGKGENADSRDFTTMTPADTHIAKK